MIRKIDGMKKLRKELEEKKLRKRSQEDLRARSDREVSELKFCKRKKGYVSSEFDSATGTRFPRRLANRFRY